MNQLRRSSLFPANYSSLSLNIPRNKLSEVFMNSSCWFAILKSLLQVN